MSVAAGRVNLKFEAMVAVESAKPIRGFRVLARRERSVGDGGVTLIEILLAAILMVVIAFPLVDALVSLRVGTHGSASREMALYLGQAIIEDVRYSLYGDATDLLDDLAAMPYEERMKTLFSGLAESGRRVACSAEAERSRYFVSLENPAGTGMVPLTETHSPETYHAARRYLCEVTVSSPVAAAEGEDPRPELAEICVRISWKGGRNLAHDRRLELHSIVSKEGRPDAGVE